MLCSYVTGGMSVICTKCSWRGSIFLISECMLTGAHGIKYLLLFKYTVGSESADMPGLDLDGFRGLSMIATTNPPT